MRILLIGCGALGGAIARGVVKIPGVKLAVYDAVEEKARALAAELGVARPDHLSLALPEAELVIEAASQEALKGLLPHVLMRGLPFVALSVGALGEPGVMEEAARLCAAHGGRLHVPSGALGGLDVVRAAAEAGLDEVTLTTAKPPAGFGLAETSGPVVLYEGPARQAVAKFPKNVNVAAALSLAGVGFERTRVRIVADPALAANTHTVVAKGAFGELVCRVENRPSPENPASSHLASLSAIALVRRLVSPITVGS